MTTQHQDGIKESAMTDVPQPRATPLAAGSVQVGGTRALSITVETMQRGATVDGEDTEHETVAECAVAENHTASEVEAEGEMAPAAAMTDEGAIEAGSAQFVAPGKAYPVARPDPAHSETTCTPAVAASPASIEAKTVAEAAPVEGRWVSQRAPAYGDTLGMLEQASQRFTAVLNEAGSGVAKLSFSLIKFAQENARNNMELAKDYIAIRSFNELFELHKAYTQKQIDLIAAQVSTLQQLTAEMASNASAQLKVQALA